MHRVTRPLLGMLLLSGAAGARADLVTSPYLTEFRYQSVNTTSAPKTTTLENTGNQALTVTAVTPAAGVYARVGGSCGAAPFTVAAQASCTLEHTFRPVEIRPYFETYTVTLAGGATVNFALTGSGEVGYLEISPPALNFAPVAVGAAGVAQIVTLHNDRPVPLRISQVTSTAGSPFARTGGTCPEPPMDFAAHGSCYSYYTFTPTQVGQVALDMMLLGPSGSFFFSIAGEGLPEIPLFDDGFD